MAARYHCAGLAGLVVQPSCRRQVSFLSMLCCAVLCCAVLFLPSAQCPPLRHGGWYEIVRASRAAVFSPRLVFAVAFLWVCVRSDNSCGGLLGRFVVHSWSVRGPFVVYSADWAMRWIGSDATFAERLVAFAAVEVRAEEEECK